MTRAIGNLLNIDYRQVEWRIMNSLLQAHRAGDGATLTSLYIDPMWALPGIGMVLHDNPPKRLVVEEPVSATVIRVRPDVRNRRERRRDQALRRRR